MAALGPDRTIIVTPPDARGRTRIPSDLQVLLILTLSTRAGRRNRNSNQRAAIKALRQAVEELGPAIRSSYNELLELERSLDQTEFKSAGKTCVLGDLERAAAKTRTRPWSEKVDPVDLIEPVFRRHTKDPRGNKLP